MALDSSKLSFNRRGEILDFIIFEETSPTRRARREIPAVDGIDIGDLVKADGTKATAVADIYGISLSKTNVFGGLTREGDIKNTALVGYAEVKDLNFEDTLAGSVAKLASLGIKVVPTGL